MHYFIPDSALLSPGGANTHPVGYNDGCMVNSRGLRTADREGSENGIRVDGGRGLLLGWGTPAGRAEAAWADWVGVEFGVPISKIAPTSNWRLTYHARNTITINDLQFQISDPCGGMDEIVMEKMANLLSRRPDPLPGRSSMYVCLTFDNNPPSQYPTLPPAPNIALHVH